jgi:hypothetical protein
MKIPHKLVEVHLIALFAFCLLQLTSAVEATGSVVQGTNTAIVNKSFHADVQGESEIVTRHALQSEKTGLEFSDDYKMLLSGETKTNLDILNDSAEIDDALDTDRILLPEETTTSSSFKSSDKFKNVYKVPKSKVKKTFTSAFGHASMKNAAVVNDFNAEKLLANLNASNYQSNFHAFVNLFDHILWRTDGLSLSRECSDELNEYLRDLRMSKEWALRVSDACGKYRGLFFFENDYWLGSKQFCYEINRDYGKKIPQLQFFVTKLIVKFHGTSQKVRKFV